MRGARRDVVTALTDAAQSRLSFHLKVYVILDFGSRGLAVEGVRVEYDLQRTMRGIRESDLPDDFADQLQAGGVA